MVLTKYDISPNTFMFSTSGQNESGFSLRDLHQRPALWSSFCGYHQFSGKCPHSRQIQEQCAGHEMSSCAGTPPQVSFLSWTALLAYTFFCQTRHVIVHMATLGHPGFIKLITTCLTAKQEVAFQYRPLVAASFFFSFFFNASLPC